MQRCTLTALLRPRQRPPPHFPQTMRSVSSFFNHNSRSRRVSDVLTVQQKGDDTLYTVEDWRLPDTRALYSQYLEGPTPDRAALSKLITKRPIYDRFGKRCARGSFIEADVNGEVHSGIVLEPQMNLFDNKEITIITSEGRTIPIQPSNITFHLHELIDHTLLESTVDTARLIQSFIKTSHIIRSNSNHLIAVVQAWYRKNNISVDIDMTNILSVIEHHSLPHMTAPLECLAFGLHMHMRRRPLEWRVNLSRHEPLKTMTSESIPTTTYTANSVILSEDLETVINMEEDQIKGFAKQLNDMGKKDMANLLTKYRDSSRREVDLSFAEIHPVVDFIKYYSQYPHPMLRSCLEPILEDTYPVTTEGLSRVLTDLCSTDSLFFSEHFAPLPEPFPMKDHFRHIRFTNANTVYALPSEILDRVGLPGHSELAVSLDKTSSRDHYTFNIHVPDVGSFLPQTSKNLKELMERVTDIDVPQQVRTLLSPENIHQLSFEPGSESTCLTVSIQYPHNEDNPWSKTKASVRLERLVYVKHVPLSDLNELWRSKFPVLSDLFNFFMPSDAYKVLDADDKKTLMSVFNMVDYWFLKRGNECSMEHQFNKQAMEDLKDEAENHEFLRYITNELKYIASEHVSKFQAQHSIPLLVQSQAILPQLNDALSVRSDNLVIPDYEATKYEELTFYKDKVGMTPITNYIGATYFLSPVQTGTSRGAFSSLGLPYGFVQVCEALHDFESILNQWQLITHLQEQFVASQTDYKMGLRTLFMKNFKTRSEKELFDFYELRVKPAQAGNMRLEIQAYRSTVMDKLRQDLERQPNLNWHIFRCVILRASSPNELADAYCFELDMRVLVKLPSTLPEVRVGDQLICSKIAAITHTELILQA